MESRAYNGFVVVVEAVQQTLDFSTRNPMVTIRTHNNGERVILLYSTLQFHTDKDAQNHGFQMAADWIQSHAPSDD